MCNFIKFVWLGCEKHSQIQPKKGQKKSSFDFFDFLTNCSYDSNESESEGKRLKPTPSPHMRFWFCFFLPTFHENIKFLKNCPYDFYKNLHSHSTPFVCAKASKSYNWNVRNIAKVSPKMAKISQETANFRLFSIFSKTAHTIRTKFSTVILHHIRVLY